ncbi:MAG: uracil-DNA glycosylase [Elusimicrobiota bacterium]|jgi:uracil-DNA glycosylase|nr:uracil-DNA glycosylase [Elusimicrobiota bacterium]
MVNIGNDWDNILKDEFDSESYKNLRSYLAKEYTATLIYPNMHDIFNALKITSFANTKVVILGQDPYHGEGEAHGLCFSVKPGIRIPQSLANIFREQQADLGNYIPNNGFLESWAESGVLLLNTILTVRAGHPLSHKNKGWETLTNHIISILNEHPSPLVFLLWGANARSKSELITSPHHLVLQTSHPSPLSASYGFLGCRHFSKANNFLISKNIRPIDWQIKNI